MLRSSGYDIANMLPVGRGEIFRSILMESPAKQVSSVGVMLMTPCSLAGVFVFHARSWR